MVIYVVMKVVNIKNKNICCIYLKLVILYLFNQYRIFLFYLMIKKYKIYQFYILIFMFNWGIIYLFGYVDGGNDENYVILII